MVTSMLIYLIYKKINFFFTKINFVTFAFSCKLKYTTFLFIKTKLSEKFNRNDRQSKKCLFILYPK